MKLDKNFHVLKIFDALTMLPTNMNPYHLVITSEVPKCWSKFPLIVQYSTIEVGFIVAIVLDIVRSTLFGVLTKIL